jgi:hypothetical protein
LRRSTLITILLGAALLTALAAALVFKAKAPPEAARLLPESDAILYLQLKALRSATHFDQTPVARSAELSQFEAATGIDPERDLDTVAFALHRMADPHGPNGAVAYSEVFTGHFDGPRLEGYLKHIAAAAESYAGHTIYSVPSQGRTLRIVELDYDTVGASNMPTAEQIHSMIDRERASALSSPGSSLLAARYGDVPLLAQAWGIGRIALPFGGDGPDGQGNQISVLGMELPLPVDTEFVASVRYTGSLHLRVEEIAPSADAAAHTVATLNTLLDMMRSIGAAQQDNSAQAVALREVLGDAQLKQDDARAVLTATLDSAQLHALSAAVPAPAAPAK